MIYASATISLVPEAKGGPFLFWDDLETHCIRAAALGFQGVEIFPREAAALNPAALKRLLEQQGLRLAAMGTGAGWLVHRLHLTHPDKARRGQAATFIEGIIDLAGVLDAPAIIGSMQGRYDQETDRAQALDWLGEGLTRLAARAARHGTKLLYEPLNRYETNLFNRLEEARNYIETLAAPNLRLLADLFHMNIEEVSIPDAIGKAGPSIGHVHWVDSNRRPAGLGHLDLAAIAQALRSIGYSGFVSAEALPYPNSEEAARQTVLNFHQLFPAVVPRALEP